MHLLISMRSSGRASFIQQGNKPSLTYKVYLCTALVLAILNLMWEVFFFLFLLFKASVMDRTEPSIHISFLLCWFLSFHFLVLLFHIIFMECFTDFFLVFSFSFCFVCRRRTYLNCVLQSIGQTSVAAISNTVWSSMAYRQPIQMHVSFIFVKYSYVIIIIPSISSPLLFI